MTEEPRRSATQIRAFLGLSSSSLLADSVEALLESGRDVDALRLLREKDGLTLEEAHRQVRKLKEEGSGKTT